MIRSLCTLLSIISQYVASPQSKFPGVVYRNKTQCNSHSKLRYLSYRGTNIRILFRRSLPPKLATLWYSSPLLCHSENADVSRTGIYWGVRKDGHHCVRGPGYRVFTAELLQEMCWPSSCVWSYIWHSWRWISTGTRLYAFKNFISDRTSQLADARLRASIFNHCNDATMRTWDVPLVQASCDVITLSRARSRFMQ